GERLPVEVLHHHVAAAVRQGPDVVDLEDVIVADAPRRAGLTLEANDARLLLDAGQERLDRDAAIDQLVVALVHGAHAALPEEADDAVLPVEELVRFQEHGARGGAGRPGRVRCASGDRPPETYPTPPDEGQRGCGGAYPHLACRSP